MPLILWGVLHNERAPAAASNDGGDVRPSDGDDTREYTVTRNLFTDMFGEDAPAVLEDALLQAFVSLLWSFTPF